MSFAVHIGTHDHLSSRQRIGMFHFHTWDSLDLCLCLWHEVLCYTSAPKSCVPLSAIGTYLSSIFTRRMVRSTWDLQLGSRWDGTHRCTTYKKRYTWRLSLIFITTLSKCTILCLCSPVPPCPFLATSPASWNVHHEPSSSHQAKLHQSDDQGWLHHKPG